MSIGCEKFTASWNQVWLTMVAALVTRETFEFPVKSKRTPKAMTYRV